MLSKVMALPATNSSTCVQIYYQHTQILVGSIHPNISKYIKHTQILVGSSSNTQQCTDLGPVHEIFPLRIPGFHPSGVMIPHPGN